MPIGMTNAQYLAHLEAKLPHAQAMADAHNHHLANPKLQAWQPQFENHRYLDDLKDDIAHYKRLAKTEPNAPFKVRR